VVHEQWIVPPHPVSIVPQSSVCALGVHVRGTHASLTAPASVGGVGVTQWLPMHERPAAQPPQLIATPHASYPISTHSPVQMPCVPPVRTQLCAVGSPGVAIQTAPLWQPLPQMKTWPLQGSVYRPHVTPEGQAVTGSQAPSPPAPDPELAAPLLAPPPLLAAPLLAPPPLLAAPLLAAPLLAPLEFPSPPSPPVVESPAPPPSPWPPDVSDAWFPQPPAARAPVPANAPKIASTAQREVCINFEEYAPTTPTAKTNDAFAHA
jgi:hypothetical protein